MCGIFAAMTRNGLSTERRDTALKLLEHRGPDGTGTWKSRDGRWTLGHTRLSIIGLRNGSQPMTSPDGEIRIPINESSDDKSQIEEYLHAYQGEGIQHIALSSGDIYASVETLRRSGVTFQDTPDTYYERLDNRIKGHGEDVARLKRDRILMDGEPDEKTGLLLQIFTQNAIGPIFFEIIQRKGNEGFGEGNFRALFESIEADQIRRGTLQDVKR